MIINLWSGPRNISTALMYAFANRGDCKVIDEPFYAHYLHLTAAEHPGKEEVLQSQSINANEVLRNIFEVSKQQKLTFIKNMAHHSVGLDLDFIKKMKNIFLLREPKEMITSFIKQIPNPTLQDLAYKHQFEILEIILKSEEKPIVIHSKDILENPEEYLKKLCLNLEIPFTEKMIKWKKGAIPEDGIWAKYWYKSLHNSEGFEPYKEKNEPVPERLQTLLQECNSYYNEMLKFKI